METIERNLSFWNFWWTAFLSSFKGAFGIVRTVMYVITIILSTLFYQHPEWGDLVHILTWALPLGIFVILFIPSVLIKSHFLYKVKAKKLDELTSTKIALIVMPNDNQYLRPRNDNVTIVGRIGIKALGLKTLEDVGIRLYSWDNSLNQYRDSYLNPADCKVGQPATFSVNPGDVPRFVEVFTWKTAHPNEPIGICYHLNYQNSFRMINPASSPFAIFTQIDVKEVKNHTLKLEVSGKDIPSIKKDFVIEIIESDLIWHEAL